MTALLENQAMSQARSIELIQAALQMRAHDLIADLRADGADLPFDLESQLGLPTIELLLKSVEEIVDADDRVPASSLTGLANLGKKNSFEVLKAVGLDAVSASVVQILRVGPDADLLPEGNGFVPYRRTIGLCKGQTFWDVPAFRSTSCATGFLVAPDLIATAGHVVRDTVSHLAAVFSEPGGIPSPLAASRVFRFGRIFRPASDDEDWALVRLVAASSVVPAVLAEGPAPEIGDAVFSVGHPNGLPMIVSPNASVRSVGPGGFKADLDTSGGCSGSLVANRAGEVVGLVTDAGPGIWQKSCKEWLVAHLVDGPALTTVVSSALLRQVVKDYSANGGLFPGE